ncbi:ATP-dependent zinc protease family protein [Hyphococcus sp.]|uniref:ATP-dependent zinc protease family protein n=1 Tax=Hyphococcus sp. TaxID=2038636 RepID=UPI0035C7788F
MRRLRLPLFLSLFAGLAAQSAHALADDEGEARGEPVTFGYIENVALGNLALSMKGKLDTGADTSSVHAYNVKVYKRGERDNWVRFRLIGKDGRAIRYDQNVIRFAAIKTKTGGLIRRPVIHLPLCVGGKWGRAEINLADRGDFEYEILIGREFLANRVLVDASRTFMAEEECEPVNED